MHGTDKLKYNCTKSSMPPIYLSYCQFFNEKTLRLYICGKYRMCKLLLYDQCVDAIIVYM